MKKAVKEREETLQGKAMKEIRWEKESDIPGDRESQRQKDG